MSVGQDAETTAPIPEELSVLIDRISAAEDCRATVQIAPDESTLLIELYDRFVELGERYNARRDLERAKEIVADQLNIRLSDAFKRIQKLASSKNRKLTEIVQMILLTDEMRQEHDAKAQELNQRKGK